MTANLTFFGSPRIKRNGADVGLRNKSVGLLAYLAATDGPATRAVLATLLWPDSPQAGVNLRKAVWDVRNALGDAVLQPNDAAKTLTLGDSAAVDCDVRRFLALWQTCTQHAHLDALDCAACEGHLAEAVAESGAEFLAGFGAGDSVEFDDWQAATAERLRRTTVDALRWLAEIAMRQGRFDQALALSRRHVELDSLGEAACRDMMRLLAWTGRRTDALREFESFAARLQDEIGVGPEPATVALRDQIASGNEPAPPPIVWRASAGETAAEGSVPRSSPMADRQVPLPLPHLAFPLPSPSPAAMPALLAAIREPNPAARLTPEELAEIAVHSPADWTGYHLSRVAEWSRPRHALAERLVTLEVAVDRGEEATAERWVSRPERFVGLGEVLAARPDSALVVLGRPGTGKSTMLRRYEYDVALASLRHRERQRTFFVQLNRYQPAFPGAQRPPPEAWLTDRWSHRYPHLPRLPEILADRAPFILLLDGLNEIPSAHPADYSAAVGAWRRFLQNVAADHPTLRVVFTCRTLDYSAPLSSPSLRVPHVHVQPLADDQIRALMEVYRPEVAGELWQRLQSSADRELMGLLRTPYFVRLLVEEDGRIDGPHDAPLDQPRSARLDRASLSTRFVRHALARELERGSKLVSQGPLLTDRDRRQVIQTPWNTGGYALPEHGPLIPLLSRLAHNLQAGHVGQATQVRVAYDTACHVIEQAASQWMAAGQTKAANGAKSDAANPTTAESATARSNDLPHQVLAAGTALGVLDDDAATDEIMFTHQLLQEYFAARCWAKSPEVQFAALPWRQEDFHPGIVEALAALPPGEPLPALVTTGWEETILMAVLVSNRPEELLRALADANLPLAGLAAAQLVRANMRPGDGDGFQSADIPSLRLSTALKSDLQRRLVQRSRDPEADLRARIAAGLALGALGDPRLERGAGPDCPFLAGPLVDIPAGDYPIGGDDLIAYLGRELDHHWPRHAVPLAAFQIGQFAVTNAEWSYFMAAGGYDDTRWWDTAVGAAWRRGEGTAEGHRAAVRYWWDWFRRSPDLVETQYKRGEFTAEKHDLWRRRLAMTAEQLEAHLAKTYPDARHTEPLYWQDDAFNNPAQPVVGIGWHEARAYCAWLSAQTGWKVRLPTEVEWEAAARGLEGRRYAHGHEYDPLSGNVQDLRIRRTTPVGVFPDGDSPDGIADMTGNTWDWTASLWGPNMRDPAFRYPYVAGGRREDPDAPAETNRVVRGGSWVNGRITARADYRGFEHPFDRTNLHGVRVVVQKEIGR